MIWRCGERAFDLAERSLIMGVVNVTPDSFSDGGRFLEPDAAVAHARALLAEGADLIDLGAESTRPGSAPVPPEEQWQRLRPVFEGLAAETGAVLSVDTASALVAQRALAAGARVVNDVSALGDPAMAAVVAEARAGLAIMHMQGTPATMQAAPGYTDVVTEVAAFLAARAAAAEEAGVARAAIVLDPGIGFGKTVAHNLALLARLDALVDLGYPVLVGVSRKGFIGQLLGGRPPADRLLGTAAALAAAVAHGARLLRVHDVAAARDVVTLAEAIARA